jgi:hypothetical protein
VAVAVRTAALPARHGAGVMAALAATACAALVLAILARSETGVVWSIALAAAAYAGALALGPQAVDGWAPLVAAGLVSAGELGQWAVELARPATRDAAIGRRRAATVAVVAAGGAAVGWLMLLAADAGSGSLVLVVAGLAAAAAAIALVARLAPRA